MRWSVLCESVTGTLAGTAQGGANVTTIRHNQVMTEKARIDIPEHILNAASMAAFPGLPAGMTLAEANRRVEAALQAAWPLIEASAGPHTVWQLDHDGRGTTLHASAEHAKAQAESNEPDGDTYWRYDDGRYWLKRHGETIATIQPEQVLGAGEAPEETDEDG